MVQSPTPRGLICSLPLVADSKRPGAYQGLRPMIARLQPVAAALLLDPMFWSADEDRWRPVSAPLLEEVIGLLPQDLALWVRITGRTPEQTIDTCRQLEAICNRLGHRGPLAWVDTPLFYHSNRGLPGHYRALLTETRFSLLADNDPELIRKVGAKTKRKNIRTAVVKKLAEEPRVSGLLHRGDLRRGMNYQRAVRGQSGFRIYDASEPGFLARPSASGVVSVGANLLPREWRTITRASLHLDEGFQGQGSRLRHLWETGQRVRTLHTYYSSAPGRIIPAVLAAWGLIPQQVHPLAPEEREAVAKILECVPEP